MKALLLAAGEGTRLRPLTLTQPKPMLPISGRAVLAITVESLQRIGITDLAINLHHCPEVVKNYFGDGSSFGVRITYLFEPELRGSAGTMKLLEPFLDETFVVVYGDVLTNLDYLRLHDFHRSACATLTLSLYRVSNPTEVGLVEIDNENRVRRFIEKPRASEVFSDLAFSGVMVAEPKIISYIAAERFFDIGHDLLPLLLEANENVFGVPVHPEEYLIDIGSHENYRRAQEEWPNVKQRAA